MKREVSAKNKRTNESSQFFYFFPNLLQLSATAPPSISTSEGETRHAQNRLLLTENEIEIEIETTQQSKQTHRLLRSPP